ncbi:glutamyl-tRNA reductase [Anaerofilum sp. An201]|nr:glutamyl-tRNA reductase [Anaerofilum sp. An201]OUP03958.1 glutamyl-tRNA reductase [Anaerofilum sp. An201]
MNIIMSGLEHSMAPLSLREKLSFTKQQTAEMVRRVRSFPHISGCVLISTCNRTELYLSCCGEQNPGELLCRAAGTEYAPYQDAFVTLAGHKAAEHLMEVAAGLRSRIFGENQIISQVRNAVALAREAGTTDPVLETLFCCAVSAGKEVRTKVKLNALPTSAASMAVDLLEKKLGDLKGKKALVIGNGEMGRLSASLLQQKGCTVSVTLRTYRHGQTIVPPGCGVVPYEDRFLRMAGCDILLSATTSPHYTVTVEQLHGVSRLPAVMVDLAIPRDIQPEAGQLDGVALYNVDDLGSRLENRTVPPEVTAILRAQMENFYRWLNYKDCMASVDSLKEAIVSRLLTARELQEGLSEAEIIELSVNKTVDLLVTGLAERITSENLTRCESKIRLHTTGRPVVS